MLHHNRVAAAVVFITWHAALAFGEIPKVTFANKTDQIEVRIGETPVATYVLRDPWISRPYFAHVKTLAGVQVTRNHPPIDGTDVTDHGTFHPGLWMAFGDINGLDHWRLKAPVVHVGIEKPPEGYAGHGMFVVRNEYKEDSKEGGNVVCEEICRITFQTVSGGYIILWDSVFSSDNRFSFGDQEEMGLGIRVATPIRVEKKNKRNDSRIVAGNGTMLDAKGRRNGDEIWGESSNWCDYSGSIDGKAVGMSLFCHPKNFRPSWFHARDYGLLLANAFGRKAFDKGESSSVVVQPGEEFRLRYGVFVHSGSLGRSDIETVYRNYVQRTAN